MYIGTVNGGIWKTTNGTAASPTWVAQTDNQDRFRSVRLISIRLSLPQHGLSLVSAISAAEQYRRTADRFSPHHHGAQLEPISFPNENISASPSVARSSSRRHFANPFDC